MRKWIFGGLVVAVIAGAALVLGAVFGALGRHSAVFPLNLFNEAADYVWTTVKGGGGQASIRAGDEISLPSTFTRLHGRVFALPHADRGGGGGDLTTFGQATLLMTHDGRFFAGTGETGFAPLPAIVPPDNGLREYIEATSRPPYEPDRQNYPNFRYNGVEFFNAPSGSGLLISYTHFDAENACYTSRLARADIAADAELKQVAIATADWRVLYDTAPCLPLHPNEQAIHVMVASGRMAIDNAADTVYLASGNYDADPVSGNEPISQDAGNDYGKVLAINIATGEARRISRGHRNPQGITRDLQGRIFTVEHGPRGGDELNHIMEGRNYGWPLAVYGSGYDEKPYPGVVAVGRHDGFEQPALAWLPSIGPGTIMTVSGFHPAWDGDLLVGTLGGQKLLHIRLIGERVVFAEEIPVGQRVRALSQNPDGSIAMWNGKNELTILTPDGDGARAPSPADLLARVDVPAPVRASAQAALTACTQCHALAPDNHASAPSLAHVFGADIGSTGFANYSAAMADADGRWTRERLNAFLRDPNSVIDGTIMPDPGLADDQVRAAVVEALSELKTQSE